MSLDLAGVFGAGLLTFFTPCVLPLIPVYLVMLMGESSQLRRGRFSLFASTLAFSLGLSAVFVGMGLAATWVGAMLGRHRQTLILLGGLIIFLFGLKLLGLLRVGWLDTERRLDGSRLRSRIHLLNALLMGVVFSLGWTPCVGPILGSVLTYAAGAAASPQLGALYLGAYAAGFVLPLLIVSLFADRARALLGRLGRWLPRIEKAGGVAVAVVGLVLMLGVAGASRQAGTPAPAGSSAPAASSASSARMPEIGRPSHKPRLVQFTSPDCPICRQMIPTVRRIEKECGGRQVEVLKVDVTQPGNRQLAGAYGVRGVPTFVFLDRGGEQVARLVGYQTLESLQQSLAALVGEPCRGLRLFRPAPAAPPLPAPAGQPACSAAASPQGDLQAGQACDS